MKRNDMAYKLKVDELFWVRVAAFLAFIIPFLACYKLWFSERVFPLAPMFDFLMIPNYLGDIALIIVFLLLFLYFVCNPNWKVGLSILGIYMYWIVVDQNRIQGFFFEIMLVVLALSQFKNDKELIKKCILFIFIGTYFFSGIHKINTVFFETWLSGLESRIPFVPNFLRESFTYAVPLLEAIFGIFLVFAKTRKLGIWLITIMHTMIVITLLFAGSGYIVFPLTFFNVFVLFYLFYDTSKVKYPFTDLKHVKSFLIILLVFILPIFNFFGLYDHIPSFSYFSGKHEYCRLYFSSLEEAQSLPKDIYKNVRAYEGQYYLDFNDWASKTAPILVYPEKRVYIKIQEHVNSQLKNPNTRLEFYKVSGK